MLAVPHSSLTPLRFCSSSSTSATASKLLMRLGQRRALGCHVAIVKGVVGSLQLLEQLKRNASAILSVLDRIGSVIPRTNGRSRAKRIGTRSAKRVPVDDGKPQGDPSSISLRPARPGCTSETLEDCRFGGLRTGSSGMSGKAVMDSVIRLV